MNKHAITSILKFCATAILYIFSREQFTLCKDEERLGGGGGERVFVYMTEDWMQVTWKRLGIRMLILTPNSGPLRPPVPHLQLNRNSIPSPPPHRSVLWCTRARASRGSASHAFLVK